MIRVTIPSALISLSVFLAASPVFHPLQAEARVPYYEATNQAASENRESLRSAEKIIVERCDACHVLNSKRKLNEYGTKILDAFDRASGGVYSPPDEFWKPDLRGKYSKEAKQFMMNAIVSANKKENDD